MTRRSPRALLAALGFAVLTFLLRLPFVSLPFGQQDEGYYAAAARATVEGRHLYADLGYVRPPGLNFPYAIGWKLAEAFGWPYDVTVRVLAALVAAATVGIVAAYLFRRPSGLPAWAGSTLAAFFGASLALQNEANSETWLMLPYVASAVLVLWYAADEEAGWRWRLAMGAAGVLTGFAALFKEVALVNLAVPALAVFALAGDRQLRRAASATALFALGVVAVYVAIVLGLASSRQVPDFLYHTWLTRLFYVADTHVRIDVFHTLGRQLVLLTRAFLVPLTAALVSALAALLAGSRERTAERRLVMFAVGWLVVSAIGVGASGRYYQHYFIQATMPAALVLAASLQAFGGEPTRAWRHWVATALALAACLLPAASWAADATGVPELHDSRASWREVAELADRVTPPGGTLLVWGDRVSVRAYAQAAPATDVIWPYYLLGTPGGHEALGKRFPSAGDRLVADLAREPDTIVLTAQLGPWLPGVRTSPLNPPDDTRAEELLLEMIGSRYREVALDEQYAVFARRR